MSIDIREAHGDFIDALIDDDAAQLYDRAPCGYLSTTPDGTIIKTNQTFLTLTGYTRDDLIGRRRFADLLSKGGQIYHETHYAPMLRMHGTVREIALDVVCRDGSRLSVLVNSVLERRPGRPDVVRTAVFDATQRREYERELLNAKQRAEASESHARSLARTLQQTLIPPTPPTIPSLDLAAEYRPSGDGSVVGGDFYDVFEVGGGDWVIVIGDVCGKGVEAAVVTALARHALRAAAVQHLEASEALEVLNEVLRRQADVDRFATVLFVRLTRGDGGWTASMCSAGHPLPLLRDPSGHVRPVGEPGSLLGVLYSPELYDATLRLESGDTLLLFTDGVPEARQGRQFYGDARIEAVATAAHESAASLAGALLDDVMTFQGGVARDDIAIVAIRVPPGV